MEDKQPKLKTRIFELVNERKRLLLIIAIPIAILIILSIFFNIGYFLTVIAAISFYAFASMPSKESDVLLLEKNERRRDIFLELKELKKALDLEPNNPELLQRFFELQKELDKK